MPDVPKRGILDALDLDAALAFSCQAFHVEGLDYLCLLRSSAITLKAYFFDEGAVGEAGMPHNHRYDFDTKVLAGVLTEVRYETVSEPLDRIKAQAFVEYDYESLLDGGRGFSFNCARLLTVISRTPYHRGAIYQNKAHLDIHTLADVKPGTILLITQYASSVPRKTRAWSRGVAPRTDGLYRKMTAADVLRRIEQLEAALGAREPREAPHG